MIKFKAVFTGRAVNAGGSTYKVHTEVSATSAEQARISLYDRFEHISNLTLTPVPDVTPEDYRPRLSN